MVNSQLETEAKRILLAEELQDTKDSLDIYVNCLFQLVQQHTAPANNRADAEAKMMLQMLFTKTLNLRGLLDGMSYDDGHSARITNLIDPTIIASGARNITELIATFHLIYKVTNSPEQKDVLYKLWVIGGLKYRQRFAVSVSSDENNAKLVEEAEQIKTLKQEIIATSFYSNLDDANKEVITKTIRNKDYRLNLTADTASYLHWQQIIDVMGFKPELTGTLYNYFSLYAHPSNVSVFQFANLFRAGGDEHIKMSMFNIKTVSAIISKFLSDYFQLFPDALAIFNSLPELNQLVMDGILNFTTVNHETINGSSRGFIR
ncbi:MAG: hypothetical protein EOO91_01965 [Pedobacter sp.]|nr:MAG: hypothetical protein EOO91_01965 [Pedobacter sp.]